VGDCMSADVTLFLGKFGTDHYRLEQYGSLQDIVNYYRQLSPRKGIDNSFVAPSLATYTGLNAAAVEDSTWSDPSYCASNESPLGCEYRLSKPAVAIIMFGTNDITVLNPKEFDYYLRLVVHDTIDRGIIPLLSTFPGDPYHEKQTYQFNQAIVQIARDYDIPVINLWLALQALPNQGLNYQSSYLSRTFQTQVSYFTKRDLEYGYTLRNLLTLQALDLIWRNVLQH